MMEIRREWVLRKKKTIEIDMCWSVCWISPEMVVRMVFVAYKAIHKWNNIDRLKLLNMKNRKNGACQLWLIYILYLIWFDY